MQLSEKGIKMVEEILKKIKEYMSANVIDVKEVQELFLSDDYLKVQYNEDFVQGLVEILKEYYGDVSDTPEDIKKYKNILCLELVISYGVDCMPEELSTYFENNQTEIWEDVSMDYFEEQENNVRINSFHRYHHYRESYSSSLPSIKIIKIKYDLDEDLRMRKFFENPPSKVKDFYSFHCEYRILHNPGLYSNSLVRLIAFWFVNNDIDSKIVDSIYESLKLGEIDSSPNGIVYKPLRDAIVGKYKVQ